MSNMLDKNGNPLKGGAIWLRQISLDGGMEAHDKKVAMQAFSDFLDSRPDIASSISENEAKQKRKKFKIVK